MTTPTAEELKRFHRYFAVECNNQAWDLAEHAERSAAQTREMLRCAHSAAWHWSKVGKPINGVRADMLLGWVCCLVDKPDDARRYTDGVRAQLQDIPEGIGGWDDAFLALLEARTRQSEGDPAGAGGISEMLDAARATLNDEEECEVFDRFRAGLSP